MMSIQVGDTITWDGHGRNAAGEKVIYQGIVTEEPIAYVGWAKVEKVNGEPIQFGTYPNPVTFHIDKVIDVDATTR